MNVLVLGIGASGRVTRGAPGSEIVFEYAPGPEALAERGLVPQEFDFAFVHLPRSDRRAM